MAAALLELLEEIEDGLGFGDDEDFAHDLLQAEFGEGRAGEAGLRGEAEVHEAGDVFGVDEADDLFGAAGGVVDGDAGVLLVDDAGAGFLDEHVGGEREDALARDHDLAGGDLVELDGAVDDGFLIFGEHAHAAGGGGDELELFGGVDSAFLGHWGAEELQNELRRSVHEADGGASEGDEDFHRPGDGDGDLFGFAEGEGFGDELAEQDVEVGNQGEAQHDGYYGDQVGVDGRVGDGLEPSSEEAGDDGFADPAEGEAAEGDAELDGGEEVVEVLLEAADGAGSEDVLGDELLDAGLADADQGEFRGDEEAVGQDEQGHRDSPKEEQAGHWLGASCVVESEGYREEREKPGFRHVEMIIDWPSPMRIHEIAYQARELRRRGVRILRPRGCSL